MTCDTCKHDGFSRLRCLGGGLWVCGGCIPERAATVQMFGFVPTVHYEKYLKNGGNVSVARVAMIKSRKLCPDGNGEVVMKSRTGKITDRRATNY